MSHIPGIFWPILAVNKSVNFVTGPLWSSRPISATHNTWSTPELTKKRSIVLAQLGYISLWFGWLAGSHLRFLIVFCRRNATIFLLPVLILCSTVLFNGFQASILTSAPSGVKANLLLLKFLLGRIYFLYNNKFILFTLFRIQWHN